MMIAVPLSRRSLFLTSGMIKAPLRMSPHERRPSTSHKLNSPRESKRIIMPVPSSRRSLFLFFFLTPIVPNDPPDPYEYS